MLGCEVPITRATEKAWQENFGEALIDGYTGFKGLDVDSDTSFYVFAYQLPPSFDVAAVIPTLRDQISKRKPCFQTVLESATELQMRCRIRTLGEAGFNEYRALVNPAAHRVTAMFGNFDSASEQRRYEYFISDFRKAHNQR